MRLIESAPASSTPNCRLTFLLAPHPDAPLQYQDGVLRICIDKKREKPSAKTISITGHDYPFTK
jgi:HSP20 family molecular chaperone IbpA